ncbi:ribonuclease P protein component [Vitreimonas flagellata]|uniref:ribonuclease P protein component n=1 Tax=Vitreimonas flagellata TaxID=2560861 RepID=UPI00142F989D|nr:ribonuclease P protein component [Vitreimonas flagellata]
MTSKSAIERLRKRAEFLFVRQGARAGRGCVLIEARLRLENGPIRVGFTASKKVGNAVARNRAKRRLREAARQLLPQHGLPGVDYVLVARQSTPDAPWDALLDDVGNALIRLRADLETGHRRTPQNRASKPPKTPTESD